MPPSIACSQLHSCVRFDTKRDARDTLHHSNVADYVRTMLRLRELPARIVHAGHEPSFGGERLIALADAYLEEAEKRGYSEHAP